MPRTNNKVECWHKLINYKATKNLTVFKLIELLRSEQSKVETDLVKLRMGEIIKKKIKTRQKIKDKNLQLLCQTYKRTTSEKLLEYLDYLSFLHLSFSNNSFVTCSHLLNFNAIFLFFFLNIFTSSHLYTQLVRCI